MLRDVFYYGKKPNVHPREKFAKDLNDARSQAVTEHFWIINEYCDYKNFDWDFDFDFLPDEDVWAEEHNNVWPSQYQKDSGTWLCSKKDSPVIVYRNDVDPVKRKNIKSDNWIVYETIDENKFDYSWHPDPTDPPYIYVFGNQWVSAKLKSTVEYHVPGATQKKYMDTIATVILDFSNWENLENIDKNSFDFTWRPDPTSPPYIYEFATQHQPNGGPRYVIKGATEKKYISSIQAKRLPCKDNWEIPKGINLNNFDFSWHPDTSAPAYIYEFGTQHQKTGGPRYVVEGAKETEYVDIQYAIALPNKKNWEILDNIDLDNFDYSWHPDSTEKPYIYVWGNQWNKAEDRISVKYTVLGATEYKYMEEPVTRIPVMENWEIPSNIDDSEFDYSWEPNPKEPEYIHQFGTQWQKTGGPRYVVEGATTIKYEDCQKVKHLPSKKNWKVSKHLDVTEFDFSWHPDDSSPPYIYEFGTQWAACNGPRYIVPGAKDIQYIDCLRAIALPNKEHWVVPRDVEADSFDFSWHPSIEDQPYIYEFGTQHQKTGGPKYMTPGVNGSSTIKYVDVNILRSKRNPNPDRFTIVNDYAIESFDFSWHPDSTDGAYNYVFGNQYYPPEIMPTIEYRMPGATQTKYVHDKIARLGKDKRNWEIPETVDISDFDFSWKPNPKDPALIYQFGTQWQKTGGPRYVVEGATNVKYVDFPVAKALPRTQHWEINDKIKIDVDKFDFSWHPDDTDPPYIYQFGTQHQKTGGPRYVMADATDIKYVDSVVATALPNKENYNFDHIVDIDIENFDYSWHPDETEDPYIYQFGTQHQKTGGPRYVVENATNIKYVDTVVAKATVSMDNWSIPNNVKFNKDDFDYSWHPDTTEEPFIYHFGTQWQKTGGPIYTVPSAVNVKYETSQTVKALPNLDNWKIPSNLNLNNFDFSWHHDITETGYSYQFGTQWQKTGGPLYSVPNSTEVKYVVDQKAIALPTSENWSLPPNIDVTDFDFSWHPDETSPPHIYHFATQWALTGGPIYTVPGATTVKYMEHPQARALPDMTNWVIPDNIDKEKFDYSWHPYVEDKPYIYQFGTQHQKTGGPRYITPGADEFSPVKYIDRRILKSVRLPDKSNFVVLHPIEEDQFDFSWHPDESEDPYIYVFGNQHYDAVKMPTVEYHVPGATQYKYVNDIKAKLKPSKKNWKTIIPIDETSWDYTWIPDPNDPPYIYVFGNQWNTAEIESTIEYRVKDATEKKYIGDKVATVLPSKKNWKILYPIIEENFDFSWRPNPYDPPYIYAFGNNLYPAESMPTVEYRVKGAEDTKYMSHMVATLAPDRENWDIPDDVDTTGFDFSWKPNPHDPPYVYEFGTQWQKTGGPRYVVKGAKEYKYVEGNKVKKLPNPYDPCWKIPEHIDITEFDFSWHPDSTEPTPYIYQFGTQWALSGGPKYVVPKAKQVKYIEEPLAKAAPNRANWIVPDDVDKENFDYSWHPYAEDQPFIYQFGTQHQKTGGHRYITPGATELSPVKYIDRRLLKSKKLPNKNNWIVPDYIDENSIDYTWHPDETEEPYIYMFGTQWHDRGGPIYKIEGAVQIKYVKDIKAKIKRSYDNWVIPDNIDKDTFDFTWRPHPNDPPYIYVFGTQHQKTGGPKYVHPDATVDSPVKYVEDKKLRATRLPDKDKFIVVDDLKIQDFDYSWHPDESDPPYIYVFGNDQYSAEIMPTIKYEVDGATEIKYVKDVVATLSEDKSNWIIPDNIDQTLFDFTWKPNPLDPPYIYEFPTQWHDRGGPKYTVEGATEKKYMDSPVARTKSDRSKWIVDRPIKDKLFDWSWVPHPDDPPYIYQFGTQWQKTGGPRYVVSGATDVKYVENIKAIAVPDRTNWIIPEDVDTEQFDFSWHPDSTEDPYIYAFGSTQYAAEQATAIKYVVFGATQTKYVHDLVVKNKVNMKNWTVPSNIDRDNFDFTWRPDPNDGPYIYVFGTQHQKNGGPRYTVPNATEYKYVDFNKAIATPTQDNWIIPEGLDTTDFDFSWHPDETAPPVIYQFGTLADDSAGPRYIVPDNNGEVVRLLYTYKGQQPLANIVNKYYIETTLEDLIAQHSDEIFWALNPDIDYSNFDFSWRPSIEQARYIHAFGLKNSINTQTYFVSGKMYSEGYRDINYVEEQSNLKISLSMFLVDKGNPEAAERFNYLKEKFGDKVQKTRYLNSWTDTINRCINRSDTNLCWILNSELDYSNFDFDYYPDPWQLKMVHIFGTQWNHWGTTFIVNRDTFSEDTKYVKVIEHLNNLNFVKDRRATATNNLYDIYVIDHGNKETEKVVELIKYKAGNKNVSTVSYEESYLKTIKNIVDKIGAKKEHYIWICSSVCNYTDFDFTYVCDPFAKENLHVFPSNGQKFGDTFLLDVNKTKEIIGTLELLQQYDKVNYNQTLRARRLNPPTITTTGDSHVNSINTKFDFPYAVFVTEDNKDIITIADNEPMNLWAPNTKNITITSTGGTRIIVPKEAKDHVKTQIYDYPYIKTASKLSNSKPLDIVFLSNGEKCAEENYEHLLAVTKNLKNKVVRVDGVNGRVDAYHAAVKASETPWAFTVFAKLKVDNKFDWGWQPDRMQIPKHYIFHAKNPLNGLEYGHQGMIAYHKGLVLNNWGEGLDFTLDDPHETVEILSGIATFNTDKFATWRTAFREVIKLKSDYTDISKERLKVWLKKARGDFAKDCLQGAKDAVEYYDNVSGDIEQLKLSYEWNWLKEYYNRKYK
jgi:hypothetical protein